MYSRVKFISKKTINENTCYPPGSTSSNIAMKCLEATIYPSVFPPKIMIHMRALPRIQRLYSNTENKK